MKRPLALVAFIAIALVAFLALALWGGRGGTADESAVLRLPLPKNPKTLDPVGITDVYSDAVARRIYNGLVKHAPDLSVVPCLARNWEISEDGRTYTFNLERGVRFHNGRELVADDVVYSLTRLADPRVSRKREMIEDVEGAAEYGALIERVMKGQETGRLPPEKLPGLSAPERFTVTIKLRRRWPLFLHLLAMSPASIVPREEVERLGQDFPRSPVGTGPFRAVTVRRNDRIILERFDGHFAGRPRLAGIRYRIIQDQVVRFESYLNGELDMTDIPLGRFKEAADREDLHRWAQLNVFYLGIAMTKKPYGENVHLRRALNFAVDRKRLCGVTLEGRGVPAKGILPPGLPGYDPDLKGYRYDPAAVRRELAAAGYPGGKGLPAVHLYYDPRNDGKPLAIELQQQFRRAGIPIELHSIDFNHLLDLTIKDPPPLYRLAWIADYPDPDNFLYVLFHSSRAGQSNRAHYRSKKADGLLEAARTLPAGADRLEAYRKAEEQIVGDAPWVFLYHRSGHLLISPKVQGVTFTPLDSGVELPQADFVKIWKER